MYCAKCGQQLPDDAAFCVKCGTKVTQSLNNQEVGDNSIEDTTITQQNDNQHSITADSSSKHEKQLPSNPPIKKIDIIITLVFILLVVGGYITLFSDSNSDNNTRWRAYNGVEYAAKNSAGVDFSLIGVEEKEFIFNLYGKIVKPNGKFVIVSVYLFNNSDKPIKIGIYGEPFQIWDKAQRKYNVITVSSINAILSSGKKSLSMYEEINPGTDILLEIPFDVPKDLDIHTSWFHMNFSYKGKIFAHDTTDTISLPLKVVTK